MEASVSDMVKIGEGLAQGFFNVGLKYFLWWIAVMCVLWGLSGIFGWLKDDTDISNWKRSGLKILRDDRTGLQYLSDGKGGLILRVDANGKPVR
jgi:cytochrome b subunit of formate dehydrogenase